MRYFMLFFLFLELSADTLDYHRHLALLEHKLNQLISKKALFVKEKQQLTNVRYDQKKSLTLTYTLQVRSEEINIQDFNRIWRKTSGDKLCVRPAIRKLISSGVLFYEQYYDINHHLISELKFGQEECAPFMRSHDNTAKLFDS